MFSFALHRIEKQKYFNHFIIGFTLIIIVTIVYAIIHIYTLTIEETKNSHQAKQFEIAKSAASGISNYLNFLYSELEFLSKNDYSKTYFEQLYRSKEKKGILKSIFQVDSVGNILFNYGTPLSKQMRTNIRNEILKKNELYDTYSFYSDIYIIESEDNYDSFYLFITVKKTTPQTSRFTYVGYIISFDWLINNFIEPLKLTENDFAWVLDSSGRLIYHPNHSEMIFRSISEDDPDCFDCHISFDIQQEMLKKKRSFDEYLILGEPKKIMAYSDIELKENFWILAVSTYLPPVISSVRENFIIFFILSGIAIVLTIAIGGLLYISNFRRIKAEESEKFLEQSRSFQEKINHAAKLASIGELVDNVAHEINTPTGIISAETDTLILKDCNPKTCCEELQIIKDQTRRISNYTKSLLNYSRRMPFLPELNDIAKVLDECLFLLSPRIRANQINVIKFIDPKIPRFVFDKGRIEQVIINLLNNAIDCVNDNKEISVEITMNELKKNGNQSSYIQLAIKDNGIGIPKENIDKIFEPFFSTKSTQNGTGLGLSISNAIVKRHNGNIEVESKINEGTSFYVNLPLVSDSE